jgi:hypothetical protein
VIVEISEELIEEYILLVEYHKVSTENRKLKQELIERILINNGRKNKKKS